MYEFWYDYINQSIKTKQNYVTWILTALLFILKLMILMPLPIGKNKKVIGLFKNELGGKIMKEFVGLRAKTWSYLMDDGNEHKKAKGTKKCLIKQGLKFKNYKDCNFNNKTILKSQQRFKSDYQHLYTEQINKIVLSNNDDKRLQTFDKITTYLYGSYTLKVCKSEMLSKYK